MIKTDTNQQSPHPPLNLVVLISGEGSNLRAIINAIEAKKLNAKIALVISNKKQSKGLNHAKNANIAHITLKAKKGQTREDYDQGLLGIIQPYQPDYLILAGFMRILSADFILAYEGNILNIHPSLLPKHKGLNTHQRVIDAHDAYHGATVHYVSEALDAGENIMQSRIRVLENDDAHSLKKRVLKEEHTLYPRAIDWLEQQRL